MPALYFGKFWTLDNLFSNYFRCFGITIFIGWVASNQASIIVQGLELPPLRYLGKVSYGIYMYQGLFLSTGPYRENGSVWPPPQSTGLLLLLLVTPMSYQFFEKRFINQKKRYYASTKNKRNYYLQ